MTKSILVQSHNHAAAERPIIERLWPSLESHRRVRAELHERLYDLDFLAFQQIMKSLLYKCGYLSVHLIGRTHKRGRTARGGLDLTAYSVTELSSSLTIAQVKQYRRPVSRRFVDELRGVMLRIGAEQGLLLTLSDFPAAARQASQDSKLAPIRLINGEEILDLLMDYRLGVQLQEGQWQIDYDYLDKLQENCRCTYRKRGHTALRHKKASHATSSKAPTASADSLSNNSSHAHLTYLQHDQSQHRGGGMIWSTHLMAGLNTLWLLELTSGVAPLTAQPNIGLLAGAAAIGALLPDLDASESKIKHLKVGGIKPMLVPAQIMHRRWGHRSLLHSMLGLVSVAVLGIAFLLITGISLGWQLLPALLLGYASHLLADVCTRSGIPLLYPRRQRFHLIPAQWRISTGSQAEDVLFVLLAIAALLLFLRHLPFGG